jgi:hypothetical protein
MIIKIFLSILRFFNKEMLSKMYNCRILEWKSEKSLFYLKIFLIYATQLIVVVVITAYCKNDKSNNNSRDSNLRTMKTQISEL